MSEPVYSYTTIVRGTQEQVWDAIVNPDQTVQYFYGTAVESTWEVNSPLEYRMPNSGALMSTGSILAIDEPWLLDISFHAMWDPELEAEGAVREVWTLEPMDGGVVSLTVELFDLALDSKTLTDFSDGFPFILSGLKTLVETGTPLSS